MAEQLSADAYEMLEGIGIQPKPMRECAPETLDELLKTGLIRVRWLEEPYKSKSTGLIEWMFITPAGRVAVEAGDGKD